MITFAGKFTLFRVVMVPLFILGWVSSSLFNAVVFNGDRSFSVALLALVWFVLFVVIGYIQYTGDYK